MRNESCPLQEQYKLLTIELSFSTPTSLFVITSFETGSQVAQANLKLSYGVKDDLKFSIFLSSCLYLLIVG